jgi:hypothetical protein
MLHGSIRPSFVVTGVVEEMNHTTHIQMPFGRHSAPASCFLQGTDRWVAKRALSGRRTD